MVKRDVVSKEPGIRGRDNMNSNQTSRPVTITPDPVGVVSIRDIEFVSIKGHGICL